jgi:hypothetical protein
VDFLVSSASLLFAVLANLGKYSAGGVKWMTDINMLPELSK